MNKAKEALSPFVMDKDPVIRKRWYQTAAKFSAKIPYSVSVLFFFAALFWAGPVIAAPLQLFVSIPPQKYLLDRLGGELVQSHVLVGQGQSPHLFHPSTKQVRALSRAKLFFAMDMEFERILVGKLKQSASSLQVVNCVRSIRKIPLHHPGHSNNDHTGMDPHVWLSPGNLKIMASNMERAMVVADPPNAQTYRGNLEKLLADLEALDQGIRSKLAPFAGASFYVFHPAFGYFAQSYQLQQEAVEMDGKSPTPKQLSSFMAKAGKEQAKVIFVQEQFDSRSAEAVAEAIGGDVVALNPLAENVADNLRLMADEIQTALSP